MNYENWCEMLGKDLRILLQNFVPRTYIWSFGSHRRMDSAKRITNHRSKENPSRRRATRTVLRHRMRYEKYEN